MSAARPLPVPPVSKRTPGGRTTAPASSSTANSRQRRRRVGARRPPRRRLGERLAQRRAGHAGARGDVAGALDLADQGRVDEAAAALGGRRSRPRPRARISAEAGTRSRGSALSAQSSLSGLKRESVASNSSTKLPRLLGRAAAGAMPGPGSPISSRTWLPIASKVRSCSLMVRRRSSPPGRRRRSRRSCGDGAAAGRGRRPGVGTIVVTTRRLITLRTWTGRAVAGSLLFGREAGRRAGRRAPRRARPRSRGPGRGRAGGAGALSHRRPRSCSPPRRRRRRPCRRRCVPVIDRGAAAATARPPATAGPAGLGRPTGAFRCRRRWSRSSTAAGLGADGSRRRCEPVDEPTRRWRSSPVGGADAAGRRRSRSRRRRDAAPPEAAPDRSAAPAPSGCFGLACLVTWTVRRITLVWTIGLSATGARPAASLR